ncbi:MAG: hypothetical protein Q4P07_03945 [Ornithinimicrobium sp.]|uniref:hypothetical protein n=1 Tax=Ornithinimicrobium sp. TaxID=1977084 RepID=UPI0026E0993E|nr:hypothetical protein [Ornithinimicrobium sp.]MDO5739281.1 hypothetical protein [Ornithinimicrobium sp.]
MRSGHRLAVALVAAVLICWLLALVTGGREEASMAGDTPAAAVIAATGDAPVVFVGVPGLTWDLITPGTTPALDRLATDAATAALVLRGTHEVTCAPDAWLTLGAGQRAGTDLPGCGDAPATGSPSVTSRSGLVRDGMIDPQAWQAWQAAAQRRALGTQLGALVGPRGCAAAYGPAAAIAAADVNGKVDNYHPAGLSDEALRLDPACRLHLISAPAVGAMDGTAALRQVDRGIADLARSLPEGSRLIVAGMGHLGDEPDAEVLIVGPADWGPTTGPVPLTLTSGSTRQAGLVQLTDLTVALRQAASLDWDDDAFAGGPLLLLDRPDHVDWARSLADAVSLAKTLPATTLGVIGILLLPLLGAGLLMRWRRVVAGAATVAMTIPVATFLVGLMPWWQSRHPGVVLTVGVVLIGAGIATLAWAGPWRRHPLGPAAIVATLTLIVIGADLFHSSRLGLVSILGLQPVTAGRFYGQGNVGFGIMLGALIVLLAAVLTWMTPRIQGTGHRSGAAALTVATLGLATLLVNASPQAGADFGGVPALVLVTGLLTLSALAVRWSFGTLAVLGAAGFVVAGVVMVADWMRGAGQRTHLGDFVQSAIEGDAGAIVARKLQQSLGILISYPLSWLAVLALVLVTVVVLTRQPGWTACLWRHPGVRPAALAGVLAMVLTWGLNDSGIAAIALTLTLLIGAALTVIGRELVPRADIPASSPQPATP